MKITVIGAGVVGVTTAYMLARSGHAVTVIEREPRTAMESSYANGGQLSFGFAAPMASPDLLAKSPGILVGADIAFRISPSFLMSRPGWMLRFAQACSRRSYTADGASLAELASASRAVFDEIQSELDLDFGRRPAGKLILHDTELALNKAFEGFSVRGVKVERLSKSECIDLDPALGHLGGEFAGGLWIEGDEVGDAEAFCRQVAQASRERFGAEFLFNTSADEITKPVGGGFDVALSTGATAHCDAIVLCTGVAGRKLRDQLGLKLPIIPITGYSLTLPLGEQTPGVAVTDAPRKIVCARIGERVRIAGFADFGSVSEEARRLRVQDLIRVARHRFGAAADFDSIQSHWVGARPATPSSLPIVGATKIPGLYLNLGHGMYGWTLSAITSHAIATTIGPALQHRDAA